MPLSDIVQVTIDRQTTAVSRAGFGTLLILVPVTTTPTSPRVQRFSSAGDAGAAFTGVASAATDAFSADPAPAQIAVAWWDTSGSETAADALDAALAADGDFYGVACTSRTAAHATAIAAWALANKRLFATASNDANLYGTGSTDIASQLAANPRAIVFFHPDASSRYPEITWMAQQLGTPPGSSTWMFKQLPGIDASSLSTTDSNTIRGKNANTYERIGGVPITREGRVCTGEYIDVIRGVDWLEARMTERIYARLVNLPKIPYTDAGVAILEGEIRSQLQAGIDQGVLAEVPAPSVQVPAVADISNNDRANRFLPDIHFNARLAGAVHAVTVRGVVTL